MTKHWKDSSNIHSIKKLSHPNYVGNALTLWQRENCFVERLVKCFVAYLYSGVMCTFVKAVAAVYN